MVGIVVVSHSEPLAVAAVELAMQMVGSDPPPVEVAAGNDGGLGTDAVAVAAAIQRADAASAGTGVLVVTDLGSAVMSSELALELVEDLSGPVRLSRAPFVEGLVAAVVQASVGSSLEAVEREATSAIQAKTAQLAGETEWPATDETAQESASEAAPDADAPSDVQSIEVQIVNPEGLHARPAVLLAKAAADLAVDVSVTNLDSGAGPASADSMLELMSLGVRQGNRVRLSAQGSAARDALETLAGLIAAGLGEGTGDEGSSS
ncbi:MAG: HPr family phosphocarrier protein [Nocardioidaceae bacterium]